MDAPVDLNRFVLTMTETAYAQVQAACDGLTDEQFFSQPTTDSNPIAWLVWHMSRARDVITSNISGENQVWVSNGWADRFGMDAEDVGIGDSPEKVAAFHVERPLVMGYLDDAHEATTRRLSMISAEEFTSLWYMPLATPGRSGEHLWGWQVIQPSTPGRLLSERHVYRDGLEAESRLELNKPGILMCPQSLYQPFMSGPQAVQRVQQSARPGAKSPKHNGESFQWSPGLKRRVKRAVRSARRHISILAGRQPYFLTLERVPGKFNYPPVYQFIHLRR